MKIRPLDREALRRSYSQAKPFPFVHIENFLEPEFALEVARSYPTFETATGHGREFKTVNEKRKVQIMDTARFPDPVKVLNDAIASQQFLDDMSYVTGIPKLLADEQLLGGGMHVTGPGGRLDVHVDFNFVEDRKLHRRINLLLYLNPEWAPQWGGEVQLWDREVKRCEHAFAPKLNRCVIFETSDISFHGVTPVTDDAPYARCSFAAYYYTREAPPHWKGAYHSTIFKARPEEPMRRYVLMPAEKLQRDLRTTVGKAKKQVKRILGMPG